MVHEIMFETPSMTVPAPREALSGRILVAEDTPESRRFIGWALRRAGAQVDLAANGREALTLLAARAASGEDYQLLLTDIEMPELDGFELVRALRASGAALPIIALTARDRAEDRLAVLAAGCNDHLTKPCQREQLVAACRRWLLAAAAGSAPSGSGMTAVSISGEC